MAEVKSIANLKSLLTTSKSTEVEFPGMDGFKLNVSYLSREDLVNIRKKSTGTVYKKGKLVEELNDELFLSLYSKGCIKGWSGLKVAYVEKLAPIDLSGLNSEDTVEFSDENALLLMKQSASFDAFISEMVTELSNFPSNSGK